MDCENRIRRLTSRGSPGFRRAGDVSPLIAIPAFRRFLFLTQKKAECELTVFTVNSPPPSSNRNCFLPRPASSLQAIICDRLLVGFATVAADEAHVSVTVTVIGSVHVGCSVCASFDLAAVL